MSGKSYKQVQRQTTLESAIEDAISNLSELGGECREASDNFPNQEHPKAVAFSEAADALENKEAPSELGELPESLRTETLTWFEAVPKDKRHNPSRASRRDNAVSALRAAVERLNQFVDEREDLLKGEENPTEEQQAEVDGWVQAAESSMNELEEIADEADGVEFPGLYG